MSIMGWVQALTPAQIRALRAMPSQASALAWVAEEEHRAAAFVELLGRMQPGQNDAAEARKRAFEQTAAARELQARSAEARAKIASLGAMAPALELQKS